MSFLLTETIAKTTIKMDLMYYTHRATILNFIDKLLDKYVFINITKTIISRLIETNVFHPSSIYMHFVVFHSVYSIWMTYYYLSLWSNAVSSFVRTKKKKKILRHKNLAISFCDFHKFPIFFFLYLDRAILFNLCSTGKAQIRRIQLFHIAALTRM